MKKTGYKETFVFIAGSTPQIITETIYALAIKTPPVHPDELHIITTTKGADMVREKLIDQGILKRLYAEYRISPAAIDKKTFLIPVGFDGAPLEDIRNEAENEAMGNLITGLIRSKSADPTVRLHCSIAGGRKTMSFYLGAALQLFGRPWDRLYHVLVSPEFEANPDFYYPPIKSRQINCNGRSLDARNAEITLAELPYIRLREKLELGSNGFGNMVRESQKTIDTAIVQPELLINRRAQTLTAGNVSLKLTPLHLTVYLAYLRQKVNRCRYPERTYCLDCTECFPSLLELATKPALEEMAKDYMVICPSRVEDLFQKYKSGLEVDTLRQAISKIKRLLVAACGDETKAAYLTISTLSRGYANTRHGIRVEKGKIRIE